MRALRTNPTGVAALSAALLATACASDLPFETDFDASGEVVVVVLGDGFVRVGDRRIPLETFVLETRWATRAMSDDELLLFVVSLRVAPGITDGDAARIALRSRDRLLDELQIMGVRNVRM